jgi:hypothetical protein
MPCLSAATAKCPRSSSVFRPDADWRRSYPLAADCHPPRLASARAVSGYRSGYNWFRVSIRFGTARLDERMGLDAQRAPSRFGKGIISNTVRSQSIASDRSLDGQAITMCECHNRAICDRERPHGLGDTMSWFLTAVHSSQLMPD